jgi:hypothetical protein
MNKPAAILFTEMSEADREKIMTAAREKIAGIPSVQVLEGTSIKLEVNLERSSICIRFMSYLPVVDTANGLLLQTFLRSIGINFNSTMLCMIHMDLGDFLVNLGGMHVEQLGSRCADGGKCHHACIETCFRKECCVPLSESGLGDDWLPKSEVTLTPRESQINHDLWALQEFYQGNDRAMAAIADCRSAVCRGEIVPPPMIRPVVEPEPTFHEATYVDDDKTELFNGMFNVKNRVVEYRGFTIKPKLDMGTHPWLTHANRISTGWVVVKDGCLALPGACWDSSLLACRSSIDLWIESGFNAEKFWELMEPFRY